MSNPNWYKSNLQDILFPRGNATQGPNVIPDVLDSDGNIVLFTANTRFVTQSTSVDVGDAPNSNTGDPLRTAFVKIDNIVEALYRNDTAKAYRLAQLEAPGRFLGMHKYADLATTFAPPLASVVDPTVGSNAHNYPQNGDWVILESLIQAEPFKWDSEYRLISRARDTAISYHTFQSPTLVSVNAYSVLRWTTSRTTAPVRAIYGRWAGQWEVVQQQTLDNFDFNIDAGLARLATGDADWYNFDSENGLIAQSQRDLYQQFNDASATTIDSRRLRSRNFEDAITELVARATVSRNDAGYYG